MDRSEDKPERSFPSRRWFQRWQATVAGLAMLVGGSTLVPSAIDPRFGHQDARIEKVQQQSDLILMRLDQQEDQQDRRDLQVLKDLVSAMDEDDEDEECKAEKVLIELLLEELDDRQARSSVPK